jgi:uncharacterized protein
VNELELIDWRRRVADLYRAVRAEQQPEAAHARWRAGRDALFLDHPQSPLPAGDPIRTSGIPYWPYDPALRFTLPVEAPRMAARSSLPTGADGITALRSLGSLELPAPLGARVELWWLEQYGGGLFLPLRDGTAGDTSYGGGRYLLDTAKGADLGSDIGGRTLTIDLNFLYHPSCRYDDAWVCPLAPPANRITAPVRAGERL